MDIMNVTEDNVFLVKNVSKGSFVPLDCIVLEGEEGGG